MNVAVVGSGPAGLMAADTFARAGYRVTIFEKRPSFGRKLLVAGASGLNVTCDEELKMFVSRYSGSCSDLAAKALQGFPPQKWLEFLSSLGFETFRGTSRRFFVREMKAATLLSAWISNLRERKVECRTGCELTSFNGGDKAELVFQNVREHFDAALIAVGGGAWEKNLQRHACFEAAGVGLAPFRSSNCGFAVAWPESLRELASKRPALKNVIWSSSLGSRQGDVLLTEYGVEGTPVYWSAKEGANSVDLKPDLSLDAIAKKLSGESGRSVASRVFRVLNLSEEAAAILRAFVPKTDLETPQSAARAIKAVPISLGDRRPLEESISSSGGVLRGEISDTFELKKHKRIFVAGECMDWDAPTGGYLIQGCVSTAWAAASALWL